MKLETEIALLYTATVWLAFFAAYISLAGLFGIAVGTTLVAAYAFISNKL